MAEEWRLTQYDGYWVSSEGRIRSPRGKILKPGKCGKPGPEYLIAYVGNYRKAKVHLMVLETFIGPRPSSTHHGAHNNGDSFDNRLENLRWATPAENMQDKLRHGTMANPPRARGEDNTAAKLTEGQAREIKARLVVRVRGDIARVAREYGVSGSTVSDLVAGRAWAHL